MKTITLFAACLLLTLTEVTANETRANLAFENEEPISFFERGIEFFVFPNGEFDFNTRPTDTQEGNYYYRTAGKRGNVQERRVINYGVLIAHDSFGRVRRIGNTFINYDFRDRVTRIGSVFMRYNRFALTQVGGMQIIYNHRGAIVRTIGNVKGWRTDGYVYTDSNTMYPTHYDTDHNYYYREGAMRTAAKKED